MNVKIIETGKTETLSITDRNGIDWTNDLIGNAGAIAFRGTEGTDQDGKFAWSEEDNAYLASQDTFDWWNKYISDYEATESEIQALADKLDVDTWTIRERIQQYQDGDYEMHRGHAITAMQEIEEEYA